MQEQTKIPVVKYTVLAIVTIVILISIFWGFVALGKVYGIWSKEQSGRAELAEAEYSKQVKVEEAKANLESEKLNALAEIERAKGAAESIRIEGGQLTDEYIKYLWVRQNTFNDKTVIYVPTEAGLPVLEAGKR